MSVKTYSRSRDGNTQIAPNFKISEFACNDGSDSILLDSRLPAVLQRIRELAGGKPVRITSAYRTPAYNAKIGGASKSKHMEGKAADIQIGGVSPETICRCAETALNEAKLPGGICQYDTFAHIDTRDVKWRAVDGGAKTVSGFTPMPAATHPSTPAVNAEPEYTSVNYTVKISGTMLRVRTEPHTAAEIVGHVNTPEQYQIVKEACGDNADKWGQIGSGEHKGRWISLGHTSPVSSAAISTVNYKVEVKGDAVRVRTGPGTDRTHVSSDGALAFVNTGDIFGIALESAGKGADLWGQISGGRYCGCWIALDFARKVMPGQVPLRNTVNEKICWVFFMSKGLSAVVIAGILANIRAESNFNPATVGDNGTSFGACQWHEGRGEAMKKFVGSDWASNLQGQLEYLWQEMSGGSGFTGGKNTFNDLRAAMSVLEATKIFMLKFERPKDQSDLAVAKRTSYGLGYYDLYSGK